MSAFEYPMKAEPPPILIGTPCPRRWTDMAGDGKTRFCEHCALPVHNLSAMSRRERKSFVDRGGKGQCIAYRLRPDGSLVTPARRFAGFLLPKTARRMIGGLLTALLTLLPGCSTRRPDAEGQPPREDSALRASGEEDYPLLLGAPLPPPLTKTAQPTHKK